MLSDMANWPRARTPRPDAPRMRPRVVATELTRIDFTEIVPEPVAFLGQAAYIQLEFFESLAKAVATAPEPAEVMAPFAPATDRFNQATAGADWYELLLGIHITSGMLDDYFAQLSEG